MLVLPMEIIGPVIGIGSLMMIAAAGVIMVRRLAPGGGDGGERDRLLDDVHARLGELDQLKQQVAELEERLDFTERVLAKQRDAERLGPPPSP